MNTEMNELFASLFEECRTLFGKKLLDYGPTWMIFREVSLVDQLWIKIKRIRTLEQCQDNSLVGEGREGEFIGLINYAAIMLMRLRFPERYPPSDLVVADTDLLQRLPHDQIIADYTAVIQEVQALMERKNHDYGAAWTEMHPHAITDQIIIKLLRVKNIARNGGRLLVSENIDAQLMDVINYSMFGLIMARDLLK